MEFQVESGVKDLGLSVCFARINGLHVEAKHPEINKKKKAAARKIKAEWATDSICKAPHVQGYRALYEKVGAGEEKLVPSCEALVRMVLKSGTLPTINTLVDLYNCMSAAHLVNIGAHDVSKITGNLRVGITTGMERSVPLGSRRRVEVRRGEYAYMDDTDILCRLDMRQCDKTKILFDTKEVILVSNNNGQISEESLVRACEDVCESARSLLGAEAEIVAVH